jgi:hypothetical protein
MPEEENKAAARRIPEEVFNGRNVDALDELLDPDTFNHESIWPYLKASKYVRAAMFTCTDAFSGGAGRVRLEIC